MVTEITDASGDIDVGIDGDARVEQVVVPGSASVNMDLDVKDNDKVENLTVTKSGGQNPIRRHEYDYAHDAIGLSADHAASASGAASATGTPKS